MDGYWAEVHHFGSKASSEALACVNTQLAGLADGRKTQDEIRRDVRENEDTVDPYNIAWVDAQNKHLADGRKTQDDIRRDVRENGDAANNPYNIAWVDAQNATLADGSKTQDD